MATNNNVPTHVFGGGITLKANNYPSTTPADVTYGGIAPTFLPVADADTTIADDEGLTFVVNTLSASRVITLPSPGASMNGRIYTFYVLTPAGAFTATFKTTGAVAIPSGNTATTATSASKSAVVTIIYANGAVQGNVVIGA